MIDIENAVVSLSCDVRTVPTSYHVVSIPQDANETGEGLTDEQAEQQWLNSEAKAYFEHIDEQFGFVEIDFEDGEWVFPALTGNGFDSVRANGAVLVRLYEGDGAETVVKSPEEFQRFMSGIDD